MKLKISRLFHWLYATLMFLPILMFIPSCLYYSLNKYATNETTTEVTYKYESNEVNTLDDLVEGNIYHFEMNTDTMDSFVTLLNENSYINMSFINITSYNFTNYTFSNDDILRSFIEESDYQLRLYISNDYYCSWYCMFNANESFSFGTIDESLDSDIFTLVGDFIYVSSRNIELDTSFISQTDYNVIDSVDTNVQDTISNKMYQAWEGVWNLPLFQWTKNSFITAPFSYITGLFGLSSDNSLNCVFTYFASISICWLVFDLIMYVPNLAHRWLDRSAIE